MNTVERVSQKNSFTDILNCLLLVDKRLMLSRCFYIFIPVYILYSFVMYDI